MHHIVQEIDINRDNLRLELEIVSDGETVYDGPGNSFTSNFLAALYSFMSGEPPKTLYGGFSTSDDNDLWRTHNPVVPVSFMRVEDPPASGTYFTQLVGDDPNIWTDGTNLYIGGISPLAAGGGIAGRVVSIQETSSGSGLWRLYDINAGGWVDVADIASIDYTTYYPYAMKTDLMNGADRTDSSTFGIPLISIGYDSTPNTYNQGYLGAEIPIVSGGTSAGTVSVGSVTISTPTVGSGQSIIEIEQIFTNRSSTKAITVNEVGLWMKWSGELNNNRDFVLMARDVITPFNLSASGTLTVKYRIIVAVDFAGGSGGFLAAFNEILYRHIAQTTREAKDIFNNNYTRDPSDGHFMVAGAGGENQWSTGYGVLANQYLGPQIGHSTKNVANTDFRLQYQAGDTVYDGSVAVEAQDSRYAHGRDNYQVQCFGPLVHGWIVSDGGGSPYAQFQVDNIFHNLAATNITVNQIGFYVGRRSLTDSIGEGNAICSNRLAAPFTLNAGEVCKVTYYFRVNL